jgi:anti-sigma factor RsiW
VTCREFAEFIAQFLDGELPSAERQAFEDHLARCRNCARYLEGYRQTVAIGRQAFADPGGPLPADVPDELADAILRARRSGSRHRQR